jgi:hypothetical protein
MTKYSETYFDPTPGLIEQLVYAVIAQRLANQNYVADVIATDFTTDSVDWNVTLDTSDNQASATLNLSMAFITLPYARQILADREGLDKRIMSYNSTSIDTIGLNHQSNYPINSYPFQKSPPYLLDFTDDANTLERRIVWICLQIQAVQSWIVRWNNCARLWMLRTYLDSVLTWHKPVPTLVELEARRDALLEELNHSLIARFANSLDSELQANGLVETVDNGFENAQSAQNYYSDNGDDPNGGSDAGYTSQGVLSDLQSQAGDSEYGDNQPDNGSSKESESPTLPDC